MKKQVSWKQAIAQSVLMALIFLMGVSMGFYQGTGSLPNLSMSDKSAYIPPMTIVSLDTVQSALVEDTTNEITYEVGWNCLDYAWTVMRNFQWQGINTSIVSLLFEDNTRHTLLLIPTTDGWYLIEAQSDAIVKPSIGGSYMGKRITAVDVLVMDWVDINEYKDAPEFGIGE